MGTEVRVDDRGTEDAEGGLFLVLEEVVVHKYNLYCAE